MIPFLLITAALLLALGGLRLGSIIQYNRRRRKRRRARGVDGLTLALLVGGAGLLLAAALLGKTAAPHGEITTDPPEQTAPSQPESGWQEEDGVRFYRNPDGSPAAGWTEIDGRRYFFNDDGTPCTGWLTLPEGTWYLKADGAMARGRVEIDGQTCFFDADGQQVLVVNPWNPVPEDYNPDLVALDEYYGSQGMQVDRSCLEALVQMMDDCNAAGSRVYVLSAYRSSDSQQALFDRKVDSYLAQGYSIADAEAAAATVVAVPGTSEHHLGLAVDIIDTSLWALTEEQADLPGQQWLMENAWRYGFILRYPEDKTDVTGIIYEPWHYRYVGQALAAQLHEQGLTLEEYMDALTE